MSKKSKKETLADKIAGVLSTTPVSYDPEDDNIDDTGAKVIEDFSDDNDDEEVLSTFRKQNIDLLADVDERYVGKKASRRSVYESDDDVSENEEESDEDNAESVESEDGESENSGDENINSSDEAEGSEESASEESGEDGDSDENEGKSEGEDDENFKHFNDVDTSAQKKKGLCVRNQMNMWENLLEMRIQLQKCLISANKMPQKEAYSEIKKESGQEFADKVSITKNSLGNLLDKLLVLQKLSLSKYPETKKLNKITTNSEKNSDGDDEIPSDTEDEKSIAEDEEEEEEQNDVPRKKRKLNDFAKDISTSHDLYKSYRNGVIQKWNDKTRIAMLKNNANSHSVLNHIEHTLSDRSKLVKRTQLKRSDYTILGQELAENESNEDNLKENDNLNVEEYNTEIYDDDDFYHQLLRELIEVKSADVTDPIQLGRQWIQLQKLRSKMKRKIDTRATKGRKIRYTVHTKLVNFMAPIEDHSWTEQAKTELFNSLFGKKEYSNTS